MVSSTIAAFCCVILSISFIGAVHLRHGLRLRFGRRRHTGDEVIHLSHTSDNPTEHLACRPTRLTPDST